MFRNYLLVALRHLVRYKTYSLINIAGLALGMACFFLIMGYVRFELTYDHYHQDADRIYRIIRQVQYEAGGDVEKRVNTGSALLPLIRESLPGIEQAARLNQSGGIVNAGEQRFVEGRFYFADPEFLQVFTLPLQAGNPRTALQDPFAVLLTQETARKYFGTAPPLGQIVHFQGHDFTVTGVLQQLPANSHFHADFLASFSSLETLANSGFFQNWDGRVWTYVKLRQGYSPAVLESALVPIADQHMDKGLAHRAELTVQPLTAIHFEPGSASVEFEFGSFTALKYLSLLAAGILLIACINFTNLATARSATRSREVGMRKVVGGSRGQLIAQFLGESVLLSLIALALALVLVEVFLPAFRTLAGKELTLDYRAEPQLLLAMLAVALVVGLLAGSYPAFLLSAAPPAQVLKGQRGIRRGGVWFRRGLVVFQFALSVTLIIGTLVTYEQRYFLTTRSLGFDKEHLVSVPLYLLSDRARNYELFKQELLKDPSIQQITVSSNKPGVTDNNGILIRAAGADKETIIGIVYVDPDYAKTLKLELAAGQDFATDLTSDTQHALLINESALGMLGEKLGPDLEVGKAVELFWRQEDKIIPVDNAQIVGVLRDFNHRPYEPPQPLVFALAGASEWDRQHALIRIRPDQLAGTVGFIETTWKRLFPDLPFRSSFLDQDIEAQYRAEQQLQTLFTSFAGLAIAVACLGLFGLASFMAERRTKEIGIRKVLGATVPGIVALLSKEFTWLVLAANLIAWPVAYLGLDYWLQMYPYRIDLGPGVFVLGGALALGIAWLTVSFQAIRAARANPVDALRYE